MSQVNYELQELAEAQAQQIVDAQWEDMHNEIYFQYAQWDAYDEYAMDF